LLDPSELFTNSVVTSAAWAWAMIEARLPPSDWLTYQIHMPWPSKAVPVAVVAVGAATTFGGVGGCSA
jgi:hypothetical protein